LTIKSIIMTKVVIQAVSICLLVRTRGPWSRPNSSFHRIKLRRPREFLWFRTDAWEKKWDLVSLLFKFSVHKNCHRYLNKKWDKRNDINHFATFDVNVTLAWSIFCRLLTWGSRSKQIMLMDFWRDVHVHFKYVYITIQSLT